MQLRFFVQESFSGKRATRFVRPFSLFLVIIYLYPDTLIKNEINVNILLCAFVCSSTVFYTDVLIHRTHAYI